MRKYQTPYEDLLPPLATSELAALKQRIKDEGGVHDPVLLTEDGVVLDGHKRLSINPKAPTKILTGSGDWSDARRRAFVLRSNDGRRNLTSDQYRELEAERKRIIKELREEGLTQREIAACLGVAHQRVSQLIGEGNNSSVRNTSSPRLDCRVKIQPTQRSVILDRHNAGTPQVQIAADYGVTERSIRGIVAKERERQKAKKAPPKLDDPPRVWCASWEKWLPTQPDCDLLLTDPPYMTDVDNVGAFAESWLPTALAKVKSTGRAYVCIGAYPDELLAYLRLAPPDHLARDDILVWTYRNTLGPASKYNYNRNWQAVLVYRGVDAAPLNCPELNEQFAVQDIAAPDGRHGNRYHQWQKPDELGERFVRHATKPGDLVLDPFCCTGTFVLAAHHFGREGRGCDISNEYLQIAIQRGCVSVEPA